MDDDIMEALKAEHTVVLINFVSIAVVAKVLFNTWNSVRFEDPWLIKIVKMRLRSTIMFELGAANC